MTKYTLLLFCCLACVGAILFHNCSPQVTQRMLSAEEMGIRPTSFEDSPARSKLNPACSKYQSYEIDTSRLSHYPMRYLRVNFHWMNSADSTQNLPEDVATKYTQGILHAMNYALENNKPMWLPHNNQIPLHPIQLRCALTPRPDDPNDDGIYFHYDDSLYYYIHVRRKGSNVYSRDVFDRYGVQLDTVLNIFMMPYHRDSIRSKSFNPESVGVALRNAVKVAAPWIQEYGPDSHWRYRGVINHELGHIFGLSHAWLSDGCPDTPEHRQPCWSRDQRPGCDTLTSNNVMDYSALQLAWTPCQIAKTHQKLSDPNAQLHKLLLPTWCTLDESQNITIQDSVVWDCHKDLNGHLTIAAGGHLTMRCRTSLPPGALITIQAGGTLVLDGGQLYQSCGQTWQGIAVQERGDDKGKFEMLGTASVEDVE